MKLMKLSALSVLALGLSAGHAQAPSSPDAIDFIHLSDTHVIQTQGIDRNALPKDIAKKGSAGANLLRFVTTMPARHHIQFLVGSGDAADGYAFQGSGSRMVRGQIQYLQSIVSKSPVPFYAALGNHDVTQYSVLNGKQSSDQAVAGEARAAWIRAVPQFAKGTYYSFEKVTEGRRFLFLVLDNGYYGGPLDAQVPTDRNQRIQHLDHEQLYWMLGQLQAHPTDVPILVMHVPLTDDEMSHQIETVVKAGTRAPVVLALVGHLHVSSAIDERPLRDGQTLFQVHTTAFFADANNWRRIHMTKDCIWISRTDDQAHAQRVINLGAAACPTALQLP